MKGIAIRTVILILIGVIIVGVMAYLIYKTGSTEVLSIYECKAKLIDICRICKNTNWDGGYDLDSDADSLASTVITPCVGYDEFSYWSGTDDCGDAKTDCNYTMGTT